VTSLELGDALWHKRGLEKFVSMRRLSHYELLALRKGVRYSDGPNDIHFCCVVLQSKLPIELLRPAVADFWPQNPLFSLLLPFSLSLLSSSLLLACSHIFFFPFSPFSVVHLNTSPSSLLRYFSSLFLSLARVAQLPVSMDMNHLIGSVFYAYWSEPGFVRLGWS